MQTIIPEHLIHFRFKRKKDMVNWCLTPCENGAIGEKILAHALRREKGYIVVWTVVEVTAKRFTVIAGEMFHPGQSMRYIKCNPVAYSADFDMWGCADFCEAECCLQHYSCPESFFEMVPKVSCLKWRNEVSRRHVKNDALPLVVYGLDRQVAKAA